MRKFAAVVFALSLSSAAFAGVELKIVSDKVNCTIANNEVVRTLTFGKEKELKMTEKSVMTFEGIEAMAEKALAVSVNQASDLLDQSYIVVKNGKETILDSDESNESLYLIRLMVKACRIN